MCLCMYVLGFIKIRAAYLFPNAKLLFFHACCGLPFFYYHVIVIIIINIIINILLLCRYLFFLQIFLSRNAGYGI